MTQMKKFKLGVDDHGGVIVELALVAPIFALMIVGIVDMSNAFSRKLALEQGAQRAIEKVMQTTGDSTVEGTLKTEAVCQVNGMNSDGTCKSNPISTSDVTVTYRLECVNGTVVVSSRTETDPAVFDALTCSAPARETRYLQVAIVDEYTPLFPIRFASYDKTSNAYPIDATAGMRTQ